MRTKFKFQLRSKSCDLSTSHENNYKNSVELPQNTFESNFLQKLFYPPNDTPCDFKRFRSHSMDIKKNDIPNLINLQSSPPLLKIGMIKEEEEIKNYNKNLTRMDSELEEEDSQAHNRLRTKQKFKFEKQIKAKVCPSKNIATSNSDSLLDELVENTEKAAFPRKLRSYKQAFQVNRSIPEKKIPSSDPLPSANTATVVDKPTINENKTNQNIIVEDDQGIIATTIHKKNVGKNNQSDIGSFGSEFKKSIDVASNYKEIKPLKKKYNIFEDLFILSEAKHVTGERALAEHCHKKQLNDRSPESIRERYKSILKKVNDEDISKMKKWVKNNPNKIGYCIFDTNPKTRNKMLTHIHEENTLHRTSHIKPSANPSMEQAVDDDIENLESQPLPKKNLQPETLPPIKPSLIEQEPTTKCKLVIPLFETPAPAKSVSEYLSNGNKESGIEEEPNLKKKLRNRKNDKEVEIKKIDNRKISANEENALSKNNSKQSEKIIEIKDGNIASKEGMRNEIILVEERKEVKKDNKSKVTETETRNSNHLPHGEEIEKTTINDLKRKEPSTGEIVNEKNNSKINVNQEIRMPGTNEGKSKRIELVDENSLEEKIRIFQKIARSEDASHTKRCAKILKEYILFISTILNVSPEQVKKIVAKRSRINFGELKKIIITMEEFEMNK